MKKLHVLCVKRIYDASAEDDGYRILIDRLWPRGIRRETARIDDWWKDIAPSAELRRWFGHKPERFAEFAEKYGAELSASAVFPGKVHQLRALLEKDSVTLLYGAKDTEHNNAAVLKEILERTLGK